LLLPDLREEARRPLLDASVGDDELNRYANEALRTAAFRVFLPDLEAAAAVVVPAGASVAALPGNFQRELFCAADSDGRPLDVVTSRFDGARLDSAHFPVGGIRFVAAVGTTQLRVWPAPEAETTIILGYYRMPHTLEQGAGRVAFASSGLLTADVPLFGRFQPGDVFTVLGSVSNDGEHVVETASASSCRVVGPLVEEASVAVNVAAVIIEAVPEHLHRNVLVNGILARAFDSREDAFEGKKNANYYRAMAEEAIRELKRDINATGYRARIAGSNELRGRSLV
jgi:hypothetical protein